MLCAVAARAGVPTLFAKTWRDFQVFTFERFRQGAISRFPPDFGSQRGLSGGNREIAPCFRAAPLALFAFGIIPLMNEHRTTEEQQALDAQYMALALEEARAAGAAGEVPIGAVVVYEPIDRGTRRPFAEPRVIARGRNRREADRDPAGHAEFLAMKEAARVLDAWRLSDCTVYVTLEPCIMCAGLMHQARVARCVYGAPDQKAGAVGTLYDIHADTRLNHQFEATGGVCEEECVALLRDFFCARRKKEKERE